MEPNRLKSVPDAEQEAHMLQTITKLVAETAARTALASIVDPITKEVSGDFLCDLRIFSLACLQTPIMVAVRANNPKVLSALCAGVPEASQVETWVNLTDSKGQVKSTSNQRLSRKSLTCA